MLGSRTAVALVLAIAVSVANAADEVGPFTLTLSGKAFEERCIALSAGETIRYRFIASAPVDFNIHYHRGKDVFYPVKQANVSDAGGAFRAESTEEYCLMWESTEGTIRLEGSVERSR